MVQATGGWHVYCLLQGERSKKNPKEGEGPRKNASGFLVMDSSLRPAWCNAEAIRILSYPDKLANLTPDVLLTARIQSSLVSRQASGESPFVSEFWSGRRRYSC